MLNLKKPYYSTDDVVKYFNDLYGETTNEQINRYKDSFNEFKKYFNKDCAYVASSSGRVEVCGNHTDHNGGQVVSCAISLDSLAFFMPNENKLIKIFSEGHGFIEVNLNTEEDVVEGTSKALVQGVVKGLENRGYSTGGFVAYINSNVLGGAGISSSASFEVLICEILNFLYNDSKVSKEENAIISQFAENEFFGKPSGLLDQTAIAFGGLKKISFANKNKLEISDVSCDLSGFSLVLINTGGSHADLTGEYAAIPSEMKSVAKYFGKERLIEVDKEIFFNNIATLKNEVSNRALLRAIHFYEENERVDELEKALKNNDYVSFLDCIKQSGNSSLYKLQNCYVSGSKEQPIPLALAIASKYLGFGANRVHGGGFAGTILNIIKNEYVEQFVKNTKKIFGNENVIPLKVRNKGVIVL